MRHVHLNVKNFLFIIPLLLIMIASSALHAQQSAVLKKPVYVIVHGAWGGSWAFRKVDSLMTESRCIVYRPSLTGLGERVHLASGNITLQTHINDVVNTILFEQLTDVILVGHSYGGMVISGVADSISDKIGSLVYLDAILPDDGESVNEIMDPNGDGLMRMTRGDYLVPQWVKAEQGVPKDVPHPLKTITDPIRLKNEERNEIPSTYILTVDPGMTAEEDNFAASAERARRRGWKVLQMSADHNPQWSAPEELARLLIELK